MTVGLTFQLNSGSATQRRDGVSAIIASLYFCTDADMIELNPVRQRITDLTDRVVSLRGYL